MNIITKAMLWLLLLSGATASSYAGTGKEGYEKEAAQYKMPAPYVKLATDLYNEMDLMAHGLEKDIFLKAYKGYLLLVNKGMVRNQHVLSIADFSQSNHNKRLYIIDLRNRRLLLQTFVSHGRNSGEEMATSFSNANNSNKSVLGFLLTADTYTGEHGLALRFRGLERGINDMVTQRAIVVHGSKFVNEKELARRGEMVNSLGCPAVPMAQSKTIIHAIKGGSVYFIYHPDETYARKSQILNGSLEWTWLQPTMVAAAPDSATLPSTTLLQ
jgi:hypothetical protein